MRRHATSTGTRATTLTDLGRRVESPATTRSSSSSSSPSSSSSSSLSSSSSSITSLPPTRSAFHRLPFGRAASFPIVSPASAVYATTAVFTDTHLCPISSCLCASIHVIVGLAYVKSDSMLIVSYSHRNLRGYSIFIERRCQTNLIETGSESAGN